MEYFREKVERKEVDEFYNSYNVFFSKLFFFIKSSFTICYDVVPDYSKLFRGVLF